MKKKVRICNLTNKDVIKMCLSHARCEGCPLNDDERLPPCYLAQKYFEEFEDEIEIEVDEEVCCGTGTISL